MSLEFVRSILNQVGNLRLRMSLDGWVAAERIKAERIALYRQYADGEHRAKLTDNMRKMLRLGADSLDEFTDNYMDVVIQTMVNRLEVTSIEADSSEMTVWLQSLLDDNRFDGIQDDIHEAAIRDGVTYVMPEWSNEEQRVMLHHELAFDGVEGMLVAYGEHNIEMAIKVWHLQQESGKVADTVRINVYLPGEIRKYVSRAHGSLERHEVPGEAWPAPWTMPDGTPIGIPIIPFRNRIRKKSDDGKSEIAHAIPLQDMLNRTLYSMVMASELAAFKILVAKGFTPPPDLTIGMWVTILDSAGAPPKNDVQVDAFAIPAGEIVPYIDECKFLAGEIGRITQTPAPELVWGEVSGESLKQREIGLLGKLKRFKVKAGNSWEDTARMAHRIAQSFASTRPPAYKRLTTRWQNSEVRDDSQTIDNAMKVRELIGDRGVLELIAPVFGWDANKINEILGLKQAEDEAKLERFAAAMPKYTPST